MAPGYNQIQNPSAESTEYMTSLLIHCWSKEIYREKNELIFSAEITDFTTDVKSGCL